MGRWLILLLLAPSFASAQLSIGNFGTQSFTTGPYAKGNAGACSALTGGIETITPNTPIAGQATMVTASSVFAGSCSIGSGTFTIGFTNTVWDGTTYTAVSTSGSTPQTIVFTSSNSLSYNSATFPNGYYAAQPDLIQDSNGVLWNVFRSCANAEVSPGCIAIRKSTNHGVTWSVQSNIFIDPGTSCNGGTQACDIRAAEVGYIPGGNLAIVYGTHDATLTTWQKSKSATCNPTSVDCTNPSNWVNQATLNVIPSGQPGNFYWCTQYGEMANLPGGALGLTIASGLTAGTTNCSGTSNAEYLLISCDQGVTYGTGTGCVGLMAQYASSPALQITTASGGYVVNPINEEMEIAYIGGTTLYGLARNNQWTSGCTSPCGQMIQWVSTNMGSTWSNALTNIGNFPSPFGNTLNNYTEVSPVLFQPPLGGYWIIAWGDRGQDSISGTFTQTLAVLVNPSNFLSAPTTYPSVPTQISFTGGLALGSYPAVASTGSGNQFLLQWDGSSPRIPGALAVWQETANPIMPNTFTMRGRAARGVAMR